MGDSLTGTGVQTVRANTVPVEGGIVRLLDVELLGVRAVEVIARRSSTEKRLEGVLSNALDSPYNRATPQ